MRVLFNFERCMWQLRRATARLALQNQKILTAKKSCAVTPFFKNVFPSSPSKWKRSSTRARDQKYQLKPKCGHTCCVHTCCRVVDSPVSRFKNSFFNMKSIIRYCCSAERIFEAPCSYNDAASTYLATVTTPNRGLGHKLIIICILSRNIIIFI